MPAHSGPLVADLAPGYSAEWTRFADALQRKRDREDQRALWTPGWRILRAEALNVYKLIARGSNMLFPRLTIHSEDPNWSQA